jgi:hypothetical protein
MKVMAVGRMPQSSNRARPSRCEQVDGEQHQHGQHVDDPLEHHGREPGRRGDRVASGHEPRPQQLTGARDQEARREADHRGREEIHVADAPERSEQRSPAPGTYRVDDERDEHEAGEREGPGLGEGPRQPGSVDAAEEEGEERERRQGSCKEPPARTGQAASTAVTNSFRSDT